MLHLVRVRRVELLLLFLTACGAGMPHATTAAAHATSEPALPEPACVADPSADALARARTEGVETGAGAEGSGTLDDVDGDSTPETVVALDCGADGSCRRAIYFSGHGCARFAATMPARDLAIVGGWHHGVRDLETYAPHGCAGLAGTITDWIWDGETYVDTLTLECGCPDGTHDATRAPRCPAPPSVPMPQ